MDRVSYVGVLTGREVGKGKEDKKASFEADRDRLVSFQSLKAERGWLNNALREGLEMSTDGRSTVRKSRENVPAILRLRIWAIVLF